MPPVTIICFPNDTDVEPKYFTGIDGATLYVNEFVSKTYMSLDSIEESLGAFISVASDKLHETYMGFGQEKKELKTEEKNESYCF